MAALNKQELLQLIERAWKEQPYPGDDRLIPRPEQPAGSSRDEHDYVAAYFKGKHWKQITRKGLLEVYEGPAYACLSFMSAEAYRFYVPAFMMIAFTEQEAYKAGDMICQAALSSLVRPQFDPELYEKAKLPGMTDATNPFSQINVERQQRWWDERVSAFAPQQREAIVGFLKYMDATHGMDYAYSLSSPKAALEYWT